MPAGARKKSGRSGTISLAAFYADCRHEVLPVTSGCRVTLTYNLLLHGDPSRPAGEEGTVTELADLLREHFGTPAPRYYGGPPASPPGTTVRGDHRRFDDRTRRSPHDPASSVLTGEPAL